MKKLILLTSIAVFILTGFYLFATRNSEEVSSPDTEITYYEDGTPVVYCDENGNRYNTVAEAKAAGLTEAQYGATYCPENTEPVSADYVGMTVVEAQAKADADGVPFRVVIEDGQPQPITKDIREGRINATVANGVVTEYSVESMTPPVEETNVPASTTVSTIIGMTTAEAEAYATTQNVPFRVVMRDGESLPVTMDLRPGRINAVVEAGLVVSYTIE
ncbi:hypothetical protein K2P47_01560 [Patescibacteria group bacterium]|nr:hypothetical protein [Patescibacteria group bacterium]